MAHGESGSLSLAAVATGAEVVAEDEDGRGFSSENWTFLDCLEFRFEGSLGGASRVGTSGAACESVFCSSSWAAASCCENGKIENSVELKRFLFGKGGGLRAAGDLGSGGGTSFVGFGSLVDSGLGGGEMRVESGRSPLHISH